jgi:predicted phosphodiesterase
MRLALISDIHGNLPALEAVLDSIAADPSIDGTYHLGDLVGYAPWPDEVVALLQGYHIPGIAGNYDSTVATGYEHCGCRYEDPRQEELSHLSYAWTLEHCSPETKRRLGRLPFRMDVRPNGGHASGPTVFLVHGAPTLNTLYWTEDRPDSFNLKMAKSAGAKAGDVICFGHTHKPWHREAEGIHFVNTGSVGRPKDGDWRAGYTVLDLSDGGVDVSVVRVEYDVERVMEAIRESSLPNEFAEFLKTGGVLT